jgi:hypothetical protein
LTKNQFIAIQAKRIIKIKDELERPFTRELKSYFFQQYKRIKNGNTELIDIRPLLRKQYVRAAKKLTGIKLKQQDKIENAIEAFLFGRPITQSNYIDDTTEKDIQKSIKIARETLAEDGNINPSDTVLMVVAAKIFRNISKSRPNKISMTETQGVVEGIRLTTTLAVHRELEGAIIDQDIEEAKELAEYSQDYTSYEISNSIGKSDNASLFSLLLIAKKTWFDIGDKKVRGAHVDASGQTVPINQPFIVDNELLMYPGDGSLGATMRNLANCRCWSSY